MFAFSLTEGAHFLNQRIQNFRFVQFFLDSSILHISDVMLEKFRRNNILCTFFQEFDSKL